MTIEFNAGRIAKADGTTLVQFTSADGLTGSAGALVKASDSSNASVQTDNPKLTNADGTTTYTYVAPAGANLDYDWVYSKLGI